MAFCSMKRWCGATSTSPQVCLPAQCQGPCQVAHVGAAGGGVKSALSCARSQEVHVYKSNSPYQCSFDVGDLLWSTSLNYTDGSARPFD